MPLISLRTKKKNEKVKRGSLDKKTQQRSNLMALKFGSIYENGRITTILPIKTISESNCFEPWPTKYKRHKLQKKHIWISYQQIKQHVKMPCTVTLIRLAPGTLDKQDNLPMAFKWIVDALAALITGDYRPGRADSTDKIEWRYDQEKSSIYAVKIIINFSG